MYALEKSITFEASHTLTHHDGKCSRLHGHSYTLTLVVESPRLVASGPTVNMVTDFGTLSAAARALVASDLDHRHLNESLGTDSPTAEYIAGWVYGRLVGSLPGLAEVRLRETASSMVVYRPPPRGGAEGGRVCTCLCRCGASIGEGGTVAAGVPNGSAATTEPGGVAAGMAAAAAAAAKTLPIAGAADSDDRGDGGGRRMGVAADPAGHARC